MICHYMPSDSSVSLTEGLSIHMLLIMTKQIETGTDIKFLSVFGFVSSNINPVAILSDTNFLHLLSLTIIRCFNSTNKNGREAISSSLSFIAEPSVSSHTCSVLESLVFLISSHVNRWVG